jgi:hypothetical protein
MTRQALFCRRSVLRLTVIAWRLRSLRVAISQADRLRCVHIVYVGSSVTDPHPF